LAGLTVVDDLGSAVAEIRDAVKALRPPVEEAVAGLPRVEQNIDTITTYMPWLIGSLGFLGVAILLNAVATARRS
jgi:hypothetical protein